LFHQWFRERARLQSCRKAQESEGVLTPEGFALTGQAVDEARSKKEGKVMAFCSSCGAQLEGDSRFCAKCGADQTANAGGAPAVPAAAPQAAIPPQPAQPFAGTPPQYPPPHMPIPVMTMPPAAPAKGNTWLWVAIVVAAVLCGLYYIGTHDKQNPGPTPTPQGQPGTPGPQGQPGTPTPQAQPGQQPGFPQQQPANPGQQPAGQGGANQALVAAQEFAGRYDGVNGYIQISQAQWRNGANVAIQTATLECIQYNAAGQSITQTQTTLRGPAQPGQTLSFSPFQIGAEAQGVAKVNCGIVAVTPAN
jgi:hypothetical protein